MGAHPSRKPRYKEKRRNLCAVFAVAAPAVRPTSARQLDEPRQAVVPVPVYQRAATFDELPRVFLPHHRDAIIFLRQHGVAAVPRGVCHGVALRNLAQCGLVESFGIPGYWGITDAGREIILPPTVLVSSADPIPWIPAAEEERERLTGAFAAIDRLRPGSILFGQAVRRSALDTVVGKSRAQKFVYFAYPVGIPLKHIAWAVEPDKPLWTDHNVSVVRHQVLGLPATRRRIATPDPLSPQERALHAQLEDEGLSPWEIEEYFAIGRESAAL